MVKRQLIGMVYIVKGSSLEAVVLKLKLDNFLK